MKKQQSEQQETIVTTQEIEVTVKLTLEVDAAWDKGTLQRELLTDIRQVMYRAHITLAPYERLGVLKGNFSKVC